VETDKEDGSASFDAARYHRAIVRPLRATPRRLPLDLRVRYDIHGPLCDEVLARHLDEVIGCWSERSREQPDYSRAVYVALLKAHQDLLTNPAVRLHSVAWWSAYQPPEPDAEAELANPPLSDVDLYTVKHLGRPIDRPSSNVAAKGDTAVGPLDAAVDTSTTGAAGDAPAADTPITDTPAVDGQLTDDASTDRVRDLRALRIGDDVELSWIWPGWATEAIVSWDSDRIHRAVDREKYRQTGCWRTALSSELPDGEVFFSLAVRGAAPKRQAWSEAVSVMAPGRRQEVTYRVRRLWYRFPSRAYTVAFRADRPPPVQCDIVIGFSGADAFPETTEACKEIGRAYLASDMSTLLVTLPRKLGSGWLRCFLVMGESITLKDPDVSTLRIRSWLR